MSELGVGPSTRITLHFSLSLEDGTIIDSNFDREPATFEVGDGNLLPGFEEAIFGLAEDQTGSFTISPEKGFGQHNPNNVQEIDRREFSPDLALQEGMVLSFADAGQGELPGVVVAIRDDFVTVDFNHPLAGRTIVFNVHIRSVEPAVTH